MSVQRAVERVLERLSDGQVEALAAACEGKRAPAGGLTEIVAGASIGARDAVERLGTAWAQVPGLSGDGIALAMRTGLRARRDAVRRRSRPVWTGPGASGEQRLTAGVLHELIAGGRDRIVLMSYAAYTLAGVAADLTAAVDRQCTVDVVFETEEDSAGAYGGHGAPFGSVAGIQRWRWPAEERPAGGAALHAKLLVVDGRRALVGSANLTHKALHANVEAGILVDDPDVADALERHVRELMAAGILRREP